MKRRTFITLLLAVTTMQLSKYIPHKGKQYYINNGWILRDDDI